MRTLLILALLLQTATALADRDSWRWQYAYTVALLEPPTVPTPKPDRPRPGDPCPTCGGSGRTGDGHNSFTSCNACNGTGIVPNGAMPAEPYQLGEPPVPVPLPPDDVPTLQLFKLVPKEEAQPPALPPAGDDKCDEHGCPVPQRTDAPPVDPHSTPIDRPPDDQPGEVIRRVKVAAMLAQLRPDGTGQVAQGRPQRLLVVSQPTRLPSGYRCTACENWNTRELSVLERRGWTVAATPDSWCEYLTPAQFRATYGWSVKRVPTFMIIANGKILDQRTGYSVGTTGGKALAKWFNATAKTAAGYGQPLDRLEYCVGDGPAAGAPDPPPLVGMEPPAQQQTGYINTAAWPKVRHWGVRGQTMAQHLRGEPHTDIPEALLRRLNPAQLIQAHSLDHEGYRVRWNDRLDLWVWYWSPDGDESHGTPFKLTRPHP